MGNGVEIGSELGSRFFLVKIPPIQKPLQKIEVIRSVLNPKHYQP
jgi:hypothetical protein